jgi:iron complex outermembrane recepter protein
LLSEGQDKAHSDQSISSLQKVRAERKIPKQLYLLYQSTTMLRSIMLILLLSASVISFSQTATLKGTIQDTTGVSISGITVHLDGTRHTRVTDENGHFEFAKIEAGSFTLTASGIGYSAKKQNVTLAAGVNTLLNLQLDISRQTLTEVVVQSRKLSSSFLTRTNTPLRDIPQNIQSVDRTLLNDQQLYTLDEAFKNVAGFTSTNFYGGFSSRGYSSGIGGVTTNGIKGSPFAEGQIPLLGNVESVEVIHGPSAILYGSGGMGGNINLVTKQPKKYTVVNASVTAGSFDLYRAQGDVTGTINKKKNLYFLAGMGWQKGGAFTRDFDKRNLQVYTSLKWELKPRTTWQINANYINDNTSNNYQPRVPIYNSQNKDSIFLAPFDFNPGTDSRYKGSSIQLQSIMEHAFTESWKLGLLVAYNESRAERKQYTASGYVRPSDNTVSRSYTWQQINSPQTVVNLYSNLKVKTWSVKHQLTAGADVMLTRNNYPNGMLQYAATRLSVFNPLHEEQYDSTGMALYTNTRMEKFTYNTLGGYIQDQIEISSKLKMLAGIRYNNYFRRYFADRADGTVVYDERPLRTENFSPRIGLVYQPVTTLSLYADYNEGFSPHYSNNAENGGPFDPETAKQYEVGAKGEFFQGRFQPFITVYQSTKKNVLQAAPRDGFPFWQEAIGEVRSRGVETGIKATFFNNLFVILNYNYNKTKITESKKPEDIGQLFSNSPQNSANGWIKYSFRKGWIRGLFAGAGFQYVDSRYFSNKKVNATNILEMPAYTVFDALIGYRYKQYSLQVNGNNLADKRYAASGVTNSYTPGMPRNIQVTFNCSFR